MGLTGVDWTVMAVYLVFVPGLSVALKRCMRTSTDFFLVVAFLNNLSTGDDR
jgi:hypothetical protein